MVRLALALLATLALGCGPGADAARDAEKTAASVPTSADAVTPLAVGTKAPNATLRTLEGEEVALASLLGDQPVALIFYRGGW